MDRIDRTDRIDRIKRIDRTNRIDRIDRIDFKTLTHGPYLPNQKCYFYHGVPTKNEISESTVRIYTACFLIYSRFSAPFAKSLNKPFKRLGQRLNLNIASRKDG